MAKLSEIPAPKLYVPEAVEKELKALQEICKQFESVDENAQRRIIAYMKSRFSRVWPYSND